MKAIVWTKYGPPDVLQLKEVEKPAPKDNEVLIKIYAATVTTADCELRSLKTPILIRLPLRIYVGLRKPKRITILGQELAGEIEAVGKNGLHFLRTANVQSGQKVLINGAGGSIGTYAVQIAKSFGAEVTVVDSAEKLAMLRSIGADHVIDYTQEDFTKSGETYDVIIDVVGKSSFSGSVRALKPNGRYILGNPSLLGMIKGRWTPMTSDKKVIIAVASYKTEYYTLLKELIEAGKIKSVIDRRYPLEQTAEAHRYVDEGHKKGNVVITLEHNNKT